jgi:hypothetical protein
MVAPIVTGGGVCVWREYGVRLWVLYWRIFQETGFNRLQIYHIFFLLSMRFAAVMNATINE